MQERSFSENSEVVYDEIKKIIKKRENEYGGLIAILDDIQRRFGYLSEFALRTVSEILDRPLAEIYAITKFYHYFRLEPRGKHLICICQGTACHVRGAPVIANEFEKQLKIKIGQTTTDRHFTLEGAHCLGACALGPVVVVDGVYHSNVKRPMVENIIKSSEEEKGKDGSYTFPVTVSCPRCNHSLMDTNYLIDKYPSVHLTVSFQRKHGWIRLSSVYGSQNFESKYEIPLDAVVNFFCPHCHTELNGPLNCPLCNSPMVLMLIRGGGTVQICSRRGCFNHMLNLGYGV